MVKEQKNKRDKYWIIWGKIALFIAIILLINYFIPSSSYERDIRIGDSNESNQEMIRIHIEILEEYGYEVLYFGYFERDNTAYIKMKSLGSRNAQVWEGLSSLEMVYPNASEYEIRILEENQDCWYDIYGNLYRAYLGSEELILNDEVVDTLTAFNLINYIIDEQGYCS